MLRHLPRQVPGPTCTAGKWYSCGESRFVGCCESDPCKTGCPQGKIHPAVIDPKQTGKLPDPSCGGESDFYSCDAANGGFWGCCKSNACEQKQCPRGDLVAASINGPEQLSTFSLTSATSTLSSATSTLSPSITSTTSTESTSTTADSTFAVSTITQSALPATGEPQTNKLPIPIIAGAAGGGGVALIVLALIIYVCVHARRSRMEHRNQLDTRLHDLPASKAKGDSDVKEDSDVQKSATESTRPLSFVTTIPPPIQPQNGPQHAPTPALSPTNTITRKPLSPQSPHLSQLSGSTARRSEQDSPWTSPYPKAAQSPQDIWVPPIQEHQQQYAWQSSFPNNAPATPRNPPEARTSSTHGTPAQNDPHAWDSVTPQTSPQRNQHAYDHQNPYSPPYNPYEYQEYEMTDEDEQRRTWASSYSQFAPPASPQDESQLSHTHSPPQNLNPRDRNSDTWDSSYSQVPPQQPHHTLGPTYSQETAQTYPSNTMWEPAPHSSLFPAPPQGNSNSPQHESQTATWEPAPHSNPFPAPPQANSNAPQHVPQTIRVVDEGNATAQPGPWPLPGDSGRELLVPQTSTPANPPPAERAHWI